MYELADRLKKTVEEIAEMSTPEYMGWRALFDVREHEASMAGADESTKWVRPPWEMKHRG